MSSSSNTTTNVINPKPCNYNCGIESIGIITIDKTSSIAKDNHSML